METSFKQLMFLMMLVLGVLSGCTTEWHPKMTLSTAEISSTMQQRMLQKIDSDDGLSPEQKKNFKDEVKSFSQHTVKEYQKDDTTARPLVVGYQQKLEEALTDMIHDKTLDKWKITIAFITPRPVTPLCTAPGDSTTTSTAVTESLLKDSIRLKTVTGRQQTVRNLLDKSSNSDITIHSFYPKSGLSKRNAKELEVYKNFQEQGKEGKIAFKDRPMNFIENVEKTKVGAIYILQSPQTFKTDSTTSENTTTKPAPAVINPLAIVEKELQEASSTTDPEKSIDRLRENVHVTAIRAAQAADADDPNPVSFAIFSGLLSNKEVKERFDQQKAVIDSGINNPNQ